MGKAFSVADAYLFTVSNWAAHTGVDLSPFANVLAYRKRVAARPPVAGGHAGGRPDQVG